MRKRKNVRVPFRLLPVVLFFGSCLIFTSCSDDQEEHHVETPHQELTIQRSLHEAITVDETVTEDAETVKLLDSFKQNLEKELLRSIGTSEEDLTELDMALIAAQQMRLVVAQKETKPADVAIQNKRGARAGLNKGTITYADMYTCFPYENKVVTLTLKGTDLKRLLQQAESKCVVQFAAALENGRAIVDTQDYLIVTNDYLAQGNDDLVLLQTIQNSDTGFLLRDILIDYIQLLDEKGSSLSSI